MDTKFTSQDLINTFWVKQSWEHGAVDDGEIQSAPSLTTPSHHDVTLSLEEMGLKDGFFIKRTAVDTSPSLNVHHASPLTPLRERDTQALSDFFECDLIQEITLDIHRYLARTYPEPCWEDEPYDFLNDYI